MMTTTWPVAVFVILQFSLGLGRNILQSPEDVQNLREYTGTGLPKNLKARYDFFYTFGPFPTFGPLPTLGPFPKLDPQDIINPDIDEGIDNDITVDLDVHRRSSNNDSLGAGLGIFFGIVFFCLLVGACVKLCCPRRTVTQGRIVTIVTTRGERASEVQPVVTEHYPPVDPPPAYDSGVQQFPAQYNPAPYPQQQYQGAVNPGFQYSPVQQYQSPPLQYQNQVPSPPHYGAPPVVKY